MEGPNSSSIAEVSKHLCLPGKTWSIAMVAIAHQTFLRDNVEDTHSSLVLICQFVCPNEGLKTLEPMFLPPNQLSGNSVDVSCLIVRHCSPKPLNSLFLSIPDSLMQALHDKAAWPWTHQRCLPFYVSHHLLRNPLGYRTIMAAMLPSGAWITNWNLQPIVRYLWIFRCRMSFSCFVHTSPKYLSIACAVCHSDFFPSAWHLTGQRRSALFRGDFKWLQPDKCHASHSMPAPHHEAPI